MEEKNEKLSKLNLFIDTWEKKSDENLDLRLRKLPTGQIIIDHIEVKSKKQGIGSQIMKDLVKDADNLGIELTLKAAQEYEAPWFKGMTADQRKNFFKKFGFDFKKDGDLGLRKPELVSARENPSQKKETPAQRPEIKTEKLPTDYPGQGTGNYREKIPGGAPVRSENIQPKTTPAPIQNKKYREEIPESSAGPVRSETTPPKAATAPIQNRKYLEKVPNNVGQNTFQQETQQANAEQPAADAEPAMDYEKNIPGFDPGYLKWQKQTVKKIFEEKNKNNKYKQPQVDLEEQNSTPINNLQKNQQLEQKLSFSVLLKPEGMIMLPIAALLDFSGLIEVIPAVGQVLSYIPDIIGVLFVGGWILIRSYFRGAKHNISIPEGANQRANKSIKAIKRLKWLRPLLFISEFIPIVGALPCWILVVYFELKD